MSRERPHFLHLVGDQRTEEIQAVVPWESTPRSTRFQRRVDGALFSLAHQALGI
jgi:hypothetical protein